MFWARCCSSCTLQAFLCSGKHALRYVPSPGERVAVSESVNSDLNRVTVWCNLWGMKLNASETKTMIVSRSRTVHPQLTPLTLDGTVLKESADLVILVVTFDAKMTFEKHLLFPVLQLRISTAAPVL